SSPPARRGRAATPPEPSRVLHRRPSLRAARGWVQARIATDARRSMMAVLLARYRVRDAAAFRRVFDSFRVTRFRHGATGHRLLGDGTGRIVVLIDFPGADVARGFAADPARLAALEEAGVTDRDDEILEELETLTY